MSLPRIGNLDVQIVAGHEYRLLPNPQRSDGHERAVMFLDGASRVMVLGDPNAAGDVLVMTVDETDADGIGESGLVHMRFLALSE